VPDITLSLSSHTALVLLAIPVAVLVAIWAYRHTTPAVPIRTRVFLTGLRAIALVALILVLGEPVLSLLSRDEEPPQIAVLIDNSRSMGVKDSFEDRREGLTGILSSKGIEDLSSIGTVRFMTFDRITRPLEVLHPDSLSLSGDVTNIAEAFRFVQGERRTQNIRAVVVISDGMVTEGGNPVYESDALGVPVYTVGVGDTSARRDVRVRAALTNSLAYVGTKVPVAVDVRSQGYSGERIEVLLRSQEGIADRQVLDLGEGTRRYDVNLSLTPKTPGVRRYTVELSVPKGDAIPANNRYSFYVKVLESKLKVVLFAGAPSADVAFLRRALEADSSLSVRAFIQRADGAFSEGPLPASVLEDADCLVFVGYPTPHSEQDVFARVVEKVRAGKNFFLIMGYQTDLGKLKSLEPDLPASLSTISGAEQEVFLSTVLSERMNPLVRFEGAAEGPEFWAGIPPVVRREVHMAPRPESKVLLTTRTQNVNLAEPIYIARSVGSRKSLIFGAYGLWQWNMHRPSEESDPVAAFLSPAVRWLSMQEEEKPLRVNPVKDVFSGQEPVELMAQLYDATLRPVDDAEVRVQIKGDQQDGAVLAEPLGSGRYRARFEGLEEGTYSYTARALGDGITLGTDQGSFSVGELTVEFQDVRPDLEILQQLADRTGGRFFRPGAALPLAETIGARPQFQSSVSENRKSIELWNAPWILGFLVLVFSSEWALRKRSGML
jgi:hypothetical protein